MSKTFEQFRTYFAPELAGIPKKVAIRAIREAVIQFCKETEILIVNAEPISVSEELKEYEIEFRGDYVPVSIDSAYLGEGESDDNRIGVTSKRELDKSWHWHILTTTSDITHVFLAQSGMCRVYPIPENDLDDSLYLSVAVAPTRDATKMEDDLIYDDHIEAIKYGAQARLFAMRGMSFYDKDAAREAKFDFERYIAEARATALQGKNSIPMTACYGGPAH